MQSSVDYNIEKEENVSDKNQKSQRIPKQESVIEKEDEIIQTSQKNNGLRFIDFFTNIISVYKEHLEKYDLNQEKIPLHEKHRVENQNLYFSFIWL